MPTSSSRSPARYRDRGIVAVGLGGEEAYYPNPPFAPAFEAARAAGLGSVPHAGEVVGAESVRTALDYLEPDRIRHGFRADRRTRRSSRSSPRGRSCST